MKKSPVSKHTQPPKLSKIAKKIYELLASHPQGMDITEIRKKLGVGVGQEHLDRRIRELRDYYHVPGKHLGKRYIYVLEGVKEQGADEKAISGRLRAQILHEAHGRCQMCGRTIAEDNIRLQIDHKIPKSWGGKTSPENLWAICRICNNGKRDYFSSFDEKKMKEIMKFPSVHHRIAYLLKLNLGKPVSSKLIEFVANSISIQDDWHRRLRELRDLGLVIRVGKAKTSEGYVESTYTLEKWKELPENPSREIRKLEKAKRLKRQQGSLTSLLKR